MSLDYGRKLRYLQEIHAGIWRIKEVPLVNPGLSCCEASANPDQHHRPAQKYTVGLVILRLVTAIKKSLV